MTARSHRGIAALLIMAAFLSVPASAAAVRPLTTGFFDGLFTSNDAPTRNRAFDGSRQVGAAIARIDLNWLSVAPAQKPHGFRPSDPSDPAYRWQVVDEAVKDASARGLRVLLSINSAPIWAEGPGPGAARRDGTWRPDPAALGEFARAAATRYSGGFRASASGSALPRVRYWQVWNEPNLAEHLSPQGVRTRHGFRLTAPTHYRHMLNAAYRALKEVRGDNFVVTGGTAPYGDRTGTRTPPVLFLRKLLCLGGRRHLKPTRCTDPAHFDAISHHPYGVGSPKRKALGADDAAIPDVGKLTRVVRAAVRKGRALPRRRKRTWITEVSWDSRPPDPDGVPERRHARWLADAFYVLWRQGADTITWFQVRDAPRGRDYSATYQSGVFFQSGKPKLAARAFRFPFVARRVGRSRLVLWGKAPARGRVTIEGRRGRRWVVRKRIRTRSSNLFLARVRWHRPLLLRARIAGERSLTRSVR